MRKIVAVLLLFVTLATVANAQQKNFVPEIVFGAKGGVNMTNVAFLPDVSQKMSLQTNFGIMARYAAEKHAGIQGEINFSQRGWKEKNEENYSYKRTANYLEVPVLAHIFFGKKGRFFVNVGPEISFLLSDKATAKNLPADDNREQHKAFDKKFDYGICAGAGFEICPNPVHIAIEGRYYFGLSDLYKNGTRHYFERSSNRFLSLNLLIMGCIKK